MVTMGGQTRVAATLQILTLDGNSFESPLTGTDVDGFGWHGSIVNPPNVSLPGVINPIVWITPAAVTDPMRTAALEVVGGPAGNTIQNPLPVVPRWVAQGAAAEHGYSLRPTLRIADCIPAQFTATAPGSLPSREDEGNLVQITGGAGIDAFGVLVDVDMTTMSGFAIRLSTLLGL